MMYIEHIQRKFDSNGRDPRLGVDFQLFFSKRPYYVQKYLYVIEYTIRVCHHIKCTYGGGVHAISIPLDHIGLVFKPMITSHYLYE